MNNDNLINLKNRSVKERKEIASKGGLASAEKRRQERKLIKDIDLELSRDENTNNNLYKLISNYAKTRTKIIVDYPHVVSDINGQKLYSPYYTEEGTINEQIAINVVRHCLNYKDEEEKQNALKWTRLYMDIINKNSEIELAKQNFLLKKEIALKEIELKNRSLDLEERKIKIKEELIRMKNKGAIDISVNTIDTLDNLPDTFSNNEDKF